MFYSLQYATVYLTRPLAPCAVLLERQTLEWDKAYGFRSCVDVNIFEVEKVMSGAQNMAIMRMVNANIATDTVSTKVNVSGSTVSENAQRDSAY